MYTVYIIYIYILCISVSYHSNRSTHHHSVNQLFFIGQSRQTSLSSLLHVQWSTLLTLVIQKGKRGQPATCRQHLLLDKPSSRTSRNRPYLDRLECSEVPELTQVQYLWSRQTILLIVVDSHGIQSPTSPAHGPGVFQVSPH